MNYKRFHPNLIHLSTIDSTSNYAAKLLKETNVVNGTAILTKRQDFGRGQRGNLWESDPDKNLTTSVILYPQIKIRYVFFLTIAVSLAVDKTLRDLGIHSSIKWPNDIYVRRMKIAGILIENQIQGESVVNTIVGLGLNVNQRAFSKEINATSIALEIDQEVDLMDVFMQFYGYLDFYCDHLMQSNFKFLLNRYYERLFQYKEVAYYEDKKGIFEGVINGVTDSGELEIATDTGIRTYALKEVKYLIRLEKGE